MAESGLSVGYPELIGNTGQFLGLGYKAYASYSTNDQALLNRIVQSGIRQVYYPRIDKDKYPELVGYQWSWLRPQSTLDIEEDDYDYDLPDDFGSMIGIFHYPASEFRRGIPIVSNSQINELRATYADLTGPPTHAAIRFKSSDLTDGQRQEVVFFPTPDDDWTLIYQYEAYSGALSSSYPYPLGGMQLAELYIESCLSVAESRLKDEIGPHNYLFNNLLIEQIYRDMKHGPKVYGKMGHHEESGIPFHRGYDGSVHTITYNGEEI